LFDRTAALFLLALGASGIAWGQARPDAPIALYDGPDREQRLLAGARKEGVLMLYTSFHEQNLPLFVSSFEKRYGVKVRTWRSGADKVLQRIVTEGGAGRFDVDAVHVGSGELEALHREKLLQRVDSPHHKNLLPAAMSAHREWVPTYLTVWVQAYNTNAVKKESLPRTFQDLLDPKWKGKLGIEAGNDDWFGKTVTEMGEQKGLKLFREIVATNGISVRKGHSLLSNLVVSGEVPFAITMHSNLSESARKQGAPVDWIALQPLVARANGVAVARKAPHPYAALLFYDFLIGNEGQKLFAERDYVPASRTIQSPLKSANPKIIEPGPALDQADRWEKAFGEVVIKRSGSD
jgi:iron(III) transport system substrate-binding protein